MQETHKRHGFDPCVERSPGGGNGNPGQYSCLQNPHRQRSLAGYSPQGHKEQDMTEAAELSLSYLILLNASKYDIHNQLLAYTVDGLSEGSQLQNSITFWLSTIQCFFIQLLFPSWRDELLFHFASSKKNETFTYSSTEVTKMNEFHCQYLKMFLVYNLSFFFTPLNYKTIT